MDKMTAGIDRVSAYLDDVLVVGRTPEEHWTRLVKVFERIEEYGFRLRLEKCSFAKPQIEYLGFILSKEGRRPNPEKIKPITDMLPPSNQKELHSFLGTISYYGNLLPGLKAMRGPLDRLLQKDVDWTWTKLEQEKFDELKNVLASDLNIINFDPKLPIIVAADACNYDLGGVISHLCEDGTEKPIAHVSRSLTAAEKGYSSLPHQQRDLLRDPNT